jgi:hypothetical protein
MINTLLIACFVILYVPTWKILIIATNSKNKINNFAIFFNLTENK